MRPCIFGVEQTASEPVQIDALVIEREGAEERPPVGGRECLPGLAVVVGTEHCACLRGDVESARGCRRNLIEVGIAVGDAPVQPGVAAVTGLEEIAVCAHGKSVIAVLEQDVQQRALLLRGDMNSLPVETAVTGTQDDGIVAHREAQVRIVKCHRCEHRPCRRLGLGPARAGVPGHQNVAALTDHDHVITDGVAVE